MRLIIFSILLTACGIPRPDTDMCVVNAPGKKLTCYNLLNDYNDDGSLKAGVKPHFKPVTSLNDLNKFIGTDPKGFGNLKAYVKKLEDEYKSKCSVN